MPAFYTSIPRKVRDLRQVQEAAVEQEPDQTPDPTPAEPEVSYRDLQVRAKNLGIPANQSREDLEAAIAELER